MNPAEACRRFPAIEATGRLVPVRRGHIHRTWVVAERWLLQACNETVFPDLDTLMGNMAAVTVAVDRRLAPLPTASGSLLWRDPSGVAWRARQYVRGRPGASPDASALGRGLGEFHRRVERVDPSGLGVHMPGFHDPRRRFAQLTPDPDLTRFAWVLEHADTLASLPVRVAHFDAKAENFIVDDDGEVVALVDLDTVMPGSWLWDVGDLVRSVCGTNPEDEPEGMRFDDAAYAEVIAGYLEAVGSRLSAEERAALPLAGLVVTFEQAIRFLADHQAGDRYYAVERPGHNWDRYRAQLALLEAMDSFRRRVGCDTDLGTGPIE